VLALALVLVVCGLALVVRACWPQRSSDLARPGSGRVTSPGREPAPGADRGGLPMETAYRRHRWSDRRPRLELTASGMRRTGHELRFCLDCPAEKSEASTSTETGPR
jgi:hypothetical protein